MRFLVSCGMERAEGASFRTAETVPGVNPTCWATTLRVTTADFWRDFLICPMIEIVSGPFGSARPELRCQTTLYQKRTPSDVNAQNCFSRPTTSLMWFEESYAFSPRTGGGWPRLSGESTQTN